VHQKRWWCWFETVIDSKGQVSRRCPFWTNQKTLVQRTSDIISYLDQHRMSISWLSEITKTVVFHDPISPIRTFGSMALIQNFPVPVPVQSPDTRDEKKKFVPTSILAQSHCSADVQPLPCPFRCITTVVRLHSGDHWLSNATRALKRPKHSLSTLFFSASRFRDTDIQFQFGTRRNARRLAEPSPSPCAKSRLDLAN
jgi:hypothetical protein